MSSLYPLSGFTVRVTVSPLVARLGETVTVPFWVFSAVTLKSGVLLPPPPPPVLTLV